MTLLKNKSTLLLFTAALINLLISTISNYSTGSFYLKAGSTIIIFLLIAFDFKKNKLNIKNFIQNNHFRRLVLVLIMFLLITGLSILYSENKIFGLQKWLTLLISTIPAVLFFYYILITWNNEKLFLFINIIQVLGIIIIIASVIVKPFSFETSYSFSINRWSYVILGRFEGILYLITLYCVIFSKSKKELIKQGILLSIIIYGIYFTGLRSSLLGIILLTPAIIIFYFIKEKIKSFQIIPLLISFILSTALIVFFPITNNYQAERYNNIFSLDEINLEKDQQIGPRISAYDISLKMIKEKPIFGWGFGGFRNNQFGNTPLYIKYPHNLFLEFGVELGIIGLVICCLILILIFHSVKFSPTLFVLFMLMFWFSLFSKDIPSQTLLLVGLAFYGLSGSTKEKLISD